MKRENRVGVLIVFLFVIFALIFNYYSDYLRISKVEYDGSYTLAPIGGGGGGSPPPTVPDCNRKPNGIPCDLPAPPGAQPGRGFCKNGECLELTCENAFGNNYVECPQGQSSVCCNRLTEQCCGDVCCDKTAQSCRGSGQAGKNWCNDEQSDCKAGGGKYCTNRAGTKSICCEKSGGGDEREVVCGVTKNDEPFCGFDSPCKDPSKACRWGDEKNGNPVFPDYAYECCADNEICKVVVDPSMIGAGKRKACVRADNTCDSGNGEHECWGERRGRIRYDRVMLCCGANEVCIVETNGNPRCAEINNENQISPHKCQGPSGPYPC